MVPTDLQTINEQLRQARERWERFQIETDMESEEYTRLSIQENEVSRELGRLERISKIAADVAHPDHAKLIRCNWIKCARRFIAAKRQCEAQYRRFRDLRDIGPKVNGELARLTCEYERLHHAYESDLASGKYSEPMQVQEAARWRGVTRQHFDRLRKRGKIRVVEDPGPLRLIRVHLDDMPPR